MITARRSLMRPSLPDRTRHNGGVDDPAGEDSIGGPGLAGIALFAAGFALVVWGIVGSSTGLVVAGLIVGLLGIVLAIRSVARRAGATRLR